MLVWSRVVERKWRKRNGFENKPELSVQETGWSARPAECGRGAVRGSLPFSSSARMEGTRPRGTRTGPGSGGEDPGSAPDRLNLTWLRLIRGSMPSRQVLTPGTRPGTRPGALHPSPRGTDLTERQRAPGTSPRAGVSLPWFLSWYFLLSGGPRPDLHLDATFTP